MSEYKLDMSKYTIDEQPIMWSDEEYRLAFQSLYYEYHKLKSERDTLIDDLTWYKAKVDRLEHENKRLTGRTRKLTTHRTMWDNLKDWRRDMLEIDKNDTQLIGLGLVMDELEHKWLYREEK